MAFDSNSYTITSRIKRPFPGREYAHKTIYNDGSETISYGPTPDPKDATDFIGKRSATKPTVNSAVKEATKPTDGSEAFIKGVARSAKKISGGKDIDPTAEGSLRRMVSKDLPNEAPRVNGKRATKPDERAKAFIESFNKEMSGKHFNETSAEPTSNSAVKNSVWNKLKNSKAGNWLKNTKVGSYFADSPLTPQNVALTWKPPVGGNKLVRAFRAIAANPVAYAANAYGMGSGGGYMPVGEHTVDQLRIEHGQDEVSSLDTVVPMNPQGTMYLDPKLGFQPTEVVEDHEGGRFYRNAQTGQFEPLDYNPRYKYYSPLPRDKKIHLIDGIFPIPAINDYLGGALSMPMSDTPLPIPPMHYDSDANKPLPPMSVDTDEGEVPSGKVEVGPDKEMPVQPVQPAQPAQSVNKPNVASVIRRSPKPGVIDDTPVAATPNVPTSNVAAPTLSSVASQAVRHNGGFDNYRRQSVLSALRAAGGISPAEAVQRGIIPWEALNYV